MSWINFFFFVIILNTVTGTVAYLLCKLLTRIAEKAGAIRVIYPMYRLVMIFYTIPFGWIYIYIKCNRVYGSYGIGDSFFRYSDHILDYTDSFDRLAHRNGMCNCSQAKG